MAFRRGDKVEVASEEDGYQGSYFEGTFFAELAKTEYIVQYKNLFKNDFSGPLLEVVSGDELRPVPYTILAKGFRPGDIIDSYAKDGWTVPYTIPAKEFRPGDIVDAYSKDGWWVGMICVKIKDKYVVYFEFKYVYPLKVVSGDELRPVPFTIPAKGFRPGDIVDVYSKDGWWVGMISGKIKDKYVVYFEFYPEFKYCGSFSVLQLGNCNWYEDNNDFSEPVLEVVSGDELMTVPYTIPAKGFRPGDIVDVYSKDGWLRVHHDWVVGGAWMSCNYKWYEDNNDFSEPVLEVVSGDELRPVPYTILAKGFRPRDIVDAYSKDGWWVGMICGKIKDKYVVYFEFYPKFKFIYPMSRLRVHQDWVSGAWKSYFFIEKKFFNNDFSEPVLEVVFRDELRPVPYTIPAKGFQPGDIVDAYSKDGWLRVHQDWVGGAWMSCNYN
ncbi:hypothetical protein POM88_034143 [Heracleum sosnowskyi]|uniref:Agenet domain-containing protein n=1 Tax=Heracleum sosnowskyi TaxID=360622 RepID=A0AAD8HK39_9APIA|nr:hypothetical protein POM88_034143 [Heracleum sosnowskyi]